MANGGKGGNRKSTWSRRALLAGAATAGGAGIVSAITGDGAGNIFGGTMALSEAYNVSGDLWIGPDTAKGDVAPDSGRVYMASDTQVEYYGDGASWIKMGVGSNTEPVPSVHTDGLTVNGIPSNVHWDEDANSPSSVTAGGSLTHTIADSRDLFHVFFELSNNDGSAAELQLQINGDATTSYYIFRTDGTSTNKNDRWGDVARLKAGQTIYGALYLGGRWNSTAAWVQTVGGVSTDSTASQLQRGTQTNATSPLDELKFIWSGSSMDLTVHVYGRDVE